MIETEENQQSQNIEKTVKKANSKKADEATMAFFLHAALFSFFAPALAFSLFLYAGGYSIVTNNTVQPEVLFVFGLIFAVFFVLTLALSLSRLLLTLFLAVLAGGTLSYAAGVLLPYNLGEYVVLLFPAGFGGQVGLFLAENGNLLVGFGFGIVFFLLLKLFRSSTLAFSTLGTLCALIYVLNLSSSLRIPEITVGKKSTVVADAGTPVKNIVFLVLADHVGYDYALNKWKEDPSQEGAAVPYFVNDFFKDNGFIFYPKAYVRYPQRSRAVAAMLNPRVTAIGEDYFAYNGASYYMIDKDVPVSLQKNAMMRYFKNKGYTVTAYQTTPIDFCAAKNGTVDKCVSYPTSTGFLFNSDLPTVSRVMLLLSQWIHSAPWGRDVMTWLQHDLIARRWVRRTTPFFGNPMTQSVPVGQSDVLARVRSDVLKSSGKNVFLAHLMMPHFPYMYNRYCELKPNPEEWTLAHTVSANIDAAGEKRRWQAYNQQLACVYGQLAYMMKELKDADVLKNTTIVIAGDKGADLDEDVAVRRNLSSFDLEINDLKKNLSTIFAIYMPENKKYQMMPTACDTGSLAGLYLAKDVSVVCQNPDEKNASDIKINEMHIFFGQEASDERYSMKSKGKEWFDDFMKNGGKAFIQKVDGISKAGEIAEANRKGDVKFITPPIADKAETAKQKQQTLHDLSVPVPTEEKTPAPVEQEESEQVKEPVVAEPVKEDVAEPVKEPTEASAVAAKDATPEEDVSVVLPAVVSEETPVPVPVTDTAKSEDVVAEPVVAPVTSAVAETASVSVSEPKADKVAEKAVVTVEPETVNSKENEPKKAVEPVKETPKKVEPTNVTPKQEEPKKAEPAKVEPVKVEPKKAEPVKVEPVKIEPKKVEAKKAAPKKAAVKPVATAKKVVKKAPKKKVVEKTTADSPLPPTTAPEQWRLDEGKKKIPVTVQAASDLTDLDLMLMDVSVSDVVAVTEKPKKTPPVPARKPMVEVSKPVDASTKEGSDAKKVVPARKSVAEVSKPVDTAVKETGVAKNVPVGNITSFSVTPTVVKTVRTTPQAVEVREKVVTTSRSAVIEAEIAAGKKTTSVVSEKPVVQSALPKEKEISSVVKTKPVAVSETPLTKETVARSRVQETSPLEKQVSGEKALVSPEVSHPVKDDSKKVKVLKESVSKRVNPYGEEEIFIVIERTDEKGRVLTPQQLDDLINQAQ